MKKVLFAVIASIITLGSIVCLPGVVSAEGICSDIDDPVIKEAAGCSENKVVGDVTDSLTGVAMGLTGLIAVIVVAVGGVKFATANGDPGKAKQARNMIIYGLIGLVVAVSAYAIVTFVSKKVLK